MLTVKRCSKCERDVPIELLAKGSAQCKPCKAAAAAAWRAANPEKTRVRNPETTRAARKRYQRSELGKAAARRQHLRRAYGITQEDYDRMAREQGGRCAICDCEPKALVVDHNHETGKVRALLCDPCNKGLGAFLDDAASLRRAADYVAVWSEC